jgi:signal transduction histidine kinase
MASDPNTPVPLLVVRLRDLERIAWHKGRPAARVLERRSLRSFVATASRALRASDILAHDDESEDFLAALVSPMRSTGAVATPTDCRATLARLASAMELGGGMDVETGWTILYGLSGQQSLAAAVEGALERGNRERERFAFFSTIGHELRTPLTSIRGYLETLIEQDLDAETTRRFLEVARSEAVRLGRLVDGMFEISMLDLRAGSHHGESSPLAASLGAALNAVAPFARARRTSMMELPYADCDVAVAHDRLVQIMVNVLENAIKHGRDEGRVVVSVAALDARYLEIRIDDDGPGVEPQERDSIFSLASRGSNAQARGWGIGLAVVRLMLERIGGEVDVGVSELGGAQFRVRVPLHEGQSLKSSTTIVPTAASIEAMPTRA